MPWPSSLAGRPALGRTIGTGGADRFRAASPEAPEQANGTVAKPAGGIDASASTWTLVGTAVEVTPIRSIDKVVIGKGSMGPITRKIQEEFFAVTNGKKADRHNWLTHVNAPVAATR